MITQENIIQVLEKLAQNKKPYLSEAQFQFELAWELQKTFPEKIEKILLEYTACAQKATATQKRKRFESDILVLLADNTYIAIELKYKTVEAKISDVWLVQQAGQPGTKYDYLWDIHRIELLMHKPKQENDREYEYYMDRECKGGYAIFLTNDSSYYNNPKKEEASAHHFRLENNRSIMPADKIDWNIKEGEHKKDWMKSRDEFHLLDEYTLAWEPFQTENYQYQSKIKKFQYLITKIGLRDCE